ncbi:hypothetical protein ANRL1_00524 [Anaerolineae bacterium]|nr:hypothetical protein ANRL1_00524 [Anaerolineae bacterium]
MNRYLNLWLIGAAIVAFLGAGSPAGAMSAYSRIYKMECSECHTKSIPELNDFGIEFYKNRLVIPGKEKSGKQADAPTATGGTAAKPASGAETTAPAQPAGIGETDGGEAAEEEQKPVEEPPPTVVYKVKSSDGSVFFTDNPQRKGGPEQRHGAGKPAAARAKRVTAQSGVKRKDQPQQAPKSPGSGSVATVARERYRSYEECMERTLVRTAAPGTAHEMMELLTTAEKKCSAFPPERR